ncbi:hypothetical protein ScalyP_jg7827 [Parmales sp. scaly parma]|nr:hypothetical protein ScalyP_jg7827 [Parmales sp. scaly parma]
MNDPETKEVFESFLSIKKTSEGELPGNFVNQEESKPNVNKPYIIMNRNNAVPAPAVGASLASRSWHEQSTQSFGAAGGGYIHIQEEGVWSQQMGGMVGGQNFPATMHRRRNLPIKRLSSCVRHEASD